MSVIYTDGCLESRVQKGQKVVQSCPPDTYEFSPIPDSSNFSIQSRDRKTKLEQMMTSPTKVARIMFSLQINSKTHPKRTQELKLCLSVYHTP